MRLPIEVTEAQMHVANSLILSSRTDSSSDSEKTAECPGLCFVGSPDSDAATASTGTDSLTFRDMHSSLREQRLSTAASEATGIDSDELQRLKPSLKERRRSETLKLDKLSIARPQREQAFANSLLQHYDVLELLGHGSTSVVHKALRKSDKQIVAVKTMEATDEDMLQLRAQEYDLLRRIEHPHIIRALDFLADEVRATVVVEYFSGKSLLKALKQSPGARLAESDARSLFHMLLQAIDYLHSHQILHRDVKCENILVRHDLSDLRLIDFNAARCVLEGESLTMTGDQAYHAPEVLAGNSATEKADIWSSGVCLHFMLAGLHPARCTDTWMLQVQARQNSSELLQRCLAVDMNARPSSREVLEDVWFSGIPVGR
eukprot:TRINITY_DN112976_c0_g1_i1.p1 TRINITY_DN112976_c0_g1~~TRINITY_DN112976_c0_g1_i1.p1  ORF type:complete len:375 (+),score=64.84 TRINITY_DN112976_c0_g1_i1:68-1192(+)